MPQASNKKKYWFYGICVIVFSTLVWILTIAISTDGANVMVPAIVNKFNCTQTEASIPFTFGSYIAMVTNFLLATWMMKVGIKKVLIPVFTLVGIGFIVIANIRSLLSYQIIMTMIIALESCVSWTPGALAANWFIKKRGSVLGVYACGAPLSTAIVTPFLSRQVTSYGMVKPYIFLGCFIILLAILALFFLKDRPEAVGLLPDNGEVDPVKLEEMPNGQVAVPKIPVKEILTCKFFWIVAVGWCFNNIAHIGIMGRFVSAVTAMGYDQNLTLNMLTIGGLLAMPVSIVWGILSDKFTSAKMNMVLSIVYILGALSFALGSAGRIPTSLLLTVLFVAFLSFVAGAVPNLMPSVVAFTFGRDNFVNVFRFVNIAVSFAKGTAFFIVARVYDATGEYTYAFVIFAVLAVITCIGFSMIKKPYVQKSLR